MRWSDPYPVYHHIMDTWFTTEPLIMSILARGLDVIGMVKQLKQRYNYKGRAYTLPEFLTFPDSGYSFWQKKAC